MLDFFKKKREEKEQLEKRIAELNNNLSNLEKEYVEKQTEYDDLLVNVALLEAKEKVVKQELDKKSLEYIDQLEGLEFEEYTKKLLEKLGYKKVEVTPASGDYGIDVLAEKDFVTYAIQCKLYSTPLGVDCIQQAFAGKQYYEKDVAIVLTNSTFTESAKELAKKTNILLWDRTILGEMLKKINGTFDDEKKISFISNEEDYEEDPLYSEVVEFCIENGKVSASLIQRKFRLGYNRAARLIDSLEERGIIGPANGSNPREVLIKKEI